MVLNTPVAAGAGMEAVPQAAVSYFSSLNRASHARLILQRWYQKRQGAGTGQAPTTTANEIRGGVILGLLQATPVVPATGLFTAQCLHVPTTGQGQP